MKNYYDSEKQRHLTKYINIINKNYRDFLKN